jgi:hypothetical protein
MQRRTDALQEWKCRFAEELRLHVERLALERIHEREDGHVSGIPAVHGLVTNLAPGVTPLLKRQTSRRQLIFGPAIGTFEDDHRFTVRLRLMMWKDPVPSSAADRVLPSWLIKYRGSS